ncbi:hypothetical protein [Streptomyces antimycoticus]|uniref:hypothetical protein n=1 Tax=Streptomyces antimycoticus TaxID=68175 RepID=UPI000A35DC88|nr:hypothetical protein [Streptomyces antimycoticus]
MSPLDPPVPPDSVLALNGVVSKLKRRVDELEKGVEANAEKMKELGDKLGSIVELLEGQAADGPPSGWVWALMDREAAASAWAVLVKWRREVLCERFPGTWESTARPCWYQHPEVVEELSVLYLTWHSAYLDPEAPPKRQADWLDRLPTVRDRFKKLLDPCQQKHRGPWGDPMDLAYATPRDHDEAEINAFIAKEVAERPERAKAEAEAEGS